MSKTTLVLIAGFIAGCGAAVVAPLIIPPAHAQTTQRWETLCVPVDRERTYQGLVEATTTAGMAAGREGWEPFSTTTYAPGIIVICFKRPAP